MSIITKDKMEILIKHQDLESEIYTISTKLKGIKQKLDLLDQEMIEFESILDTEKNIIKDLQQKYRGYESDSQMNIAKMEKSQEKLKTVKTNKEYQSSLKEIEDIKEINSKIEDNMIECLEQIEVSEKNISQKKEELNQFKSKVEKEKHNIIQESEEDKNKLILLEGNLEDIVKTIDPSLMNQYNIVKKKVGRIAVVAVIKSVCQGCNVNIPPQMYNELQRCENLFFCPHCQRIIYPNALASEPVN